MKQIDYDAPATLYVRHETGIPGDTRTDVRDFNSIAEAIKHAMEELAHVDGAYIAGATQRLEAEDIRQAYDRDDFPLERRASRSQQVSKSTNSAS